LETTLYTLLVKTAEAGLLLQAPNGSMPAGNNGPYKDDETPVRNTAHWMITFLKAYHISTASNFETAARLCLSYLMSREARPMEAVFWHRKNPAKDFSNGLMGQAWTLEALVSAYGHFQEEDILRKAEEVFLKHPYDTHFKAWKTVNVDGSIYGFDMTFNHQLWFAAAGTMLSRYGNKTILSQVQDFNGAIDKNLECYPNGVIKHLPIDYLCGSRLAKIKGRIRALKFKKDYLYHKAVGYHGFNLYALGLIYKQNPSLPIFTSDKFRSALQVIFSAEFKAELDQSPYAYPYNPPGIEIGFALETFGHQPKVQGWLQKQFGTTHDFKKNLMSLGQKDDPHTYAARIYEATRLEDCDLVL